MRTKEQSRVVVDEPDQGNNNMDRYEVKKKIGQGSFGNVYLTVHRKTRQTVVLKEVKVSRMRQKKLVKSNFCEIAFLDSFKLFPSSKIDFWPFFKLQKMDFGQKKFKAALNRRALF